MRVLFSLFNVVFCCNFVATEEHAGNVVAVGGYNFVVHHVNFIRGQISFVLLIDKYIIRN